MLKFYRMLLSIFLLGSVGFLFAYELDENGKQIYVSDKKAVNAVDDVEMQENEALTNKQIDNIVNKVEAQDKKK